MKRFPLFRFCVVHKNISCGLIFMSRRSPLRYYKTNSNKQGRAESTSGWGETPLFLLDTTKSFHLLMNYHSVGPKSKRVNIDCIDLMVHPLNSASSPFHSKTSEAFGRSTQNSSYLFAPIH